MLAVSWQVIREVSQLHSPFAICISVVESLPRNWFSERNGKRLVFLFVEFVDQEQHLDVDFDAEFLAYVGEVVEEVAVSPRDMCRYDVAVICLGFCDESLLPLEVDDFAFLFS